MSLLLTIGVSAWGQSSTWTHDFASPEAISDNSITVDGVTWSVSTTSGAGSPTMTTGKYSSTYGLKFGSSKSVYYGSVTFSTDFFNNYNIQSVSVNLLNNGKKTGTLTATQGETLIGSTSSEFGTTWTTLTVDNTSGSGGSLSFTYSVEQAFYIHSITVTYSTGGGSSAAATTTTIDASGITNTDVYTSTAAGSLSATVTSGGSTIPSATVTWSSSNENVATIANDGTVTLVAAGTTTITASYAGVSGTYEASSATYSLTVTNSAPANELVTVDDDGNVTFLFNETGWGIPEGNTNKIVGPASYTNSGYTITVAGSTGNGFYYGNNYLLMGKSGAYLTLPAFDFDVERIEVEGTGTASEYVVQNIYVGDVAVSTATTGAKNITNSYAIADAYQAAGNVYTLKVTSAHNTQITSIKVYKKSTTPSLSFASATGTVNVGGTYTQTVNSYNIGENTVNYTTSNAEIATVNASTGEVTGVTAGTVTITAHVTVEGVEYTAEYELTIQKNDPELSFATPVVSISETETYAGQTVTKPADILDSEITYSSNNPTVAMVDAATGAITVGSALGSATITATFAGNTKYNAATATYTFKVTAASVASGDYVKVTSTEDLTDGEYLIVYEDGSVAFNGGLSTLDVASNYISVTITDDDKIESTAEVDAAAFTISTVDGGFSILSASGWYIGRTANSNGITTSETTAYVNNIEIDNNHDAVITVSNGRILRYNSDSGQTRFRYYGSGQKAIQLYKKSGSTGPTVAAPVITPETGTYETRPQTVSITCSTAGATIYYTTDGTTPTTSSAVYTAPFDVRKNTTVMAIAVMTVDGSTVVSRVASSVITMKVNAPVFTPATGVSFSETYNVSISADDGLTIYYITQDNKIFNTDEGGRTATASDGNGTLVSTAQVYGSELTFGQSIMVTAICKDADGNLSDPVTVKYTYTGSIVPPYYSSFSASEGDFTNSQEPDENTITGNGAPEWKMNSNTGASAIERWGEERYYMFVRGTSGNTVQTRTRWYGSAYFTSPIIDLTDKGSATFSFIHAAHHFYNDPNTSTTVNNASLETTLDDTKISEACKVQVGVCDASGNVSTWTDIPSSSINWPEQKFDPSKSGVSSDGKTTTNTSSRSGLFPRANSGDISLSDYENEKIRIRFVYTSTPQNYGTWNIDQITVNAVDVEEITMNAKGWTTYVFDHDIDAYTTTQNYVSGGEETLKIYKVTEFDHENCVLQQLGKFEEYTTANNSERYIPAKTPVVINGPASTNIVFVQYTSSEMLPTVKNNLLIGSLNPNLAVAPAGSGVRYFVLQWNNSTNAPWFNKVSEGRSVPDHKAYLNGTDQVEAVSTTQSIKERGIYVIGGEEAGTATAIENVESTDDKVQGIIYNLSGQRVLNPTKGIYIVNGKKVLFK